MGNLSCRINNAGTNAYKYRLLSDLGEADIVNIIETNVLGVMLCCREVTPWQSAINSHLTLFLPARPLLTCLLHPGYQGDATADQHGTHIQHGRCRWLLIPLFVSSRCTGRGNQQICL